MSSYNWKVEFFSQLHEDLTDQPVDSDAMREVLEERGIDVTATVTSGLELIAEHKSRMRLIDARRKFNRLRSIVERWAAQGTGRLAPVKDDIARALSGETTGPAYQAYHRKLKALSAQDLETLGEDAALLEFLAEVGPDEVEE